MNSNQPTTAPSQSLPTDSARVLSPSDLAKIAGGPIVQNRSM